jgi:hypothetical protein
MEPQNIDEVILAIQADPPKIVKSKSGQVGQQKTRYADLVEVAAAVMPVLTSMKTIWKAKPTRLLDHEGYPFVLAYELKHLPSGTSEVGYFPLKLDENSQKVGSAVTYARRYALVGVLGLVPEDEDDDGGITNGQRTAQRAAPAAARKPRPAASTAAPEPGQAETAPATARRAARPAGPALPSERAAADEPHRGRGGLITGPMATKLAITMKEVIGDNPADRKQFIVDMIGHEVASSKELTFDEGRGLIDAFEKAKKTDNPIGNVIDIYNRTTGNVPWAEDVDTTLPGGRQPGQPSRNAREAIGTGDVGTEQAPWESGGLPA